MIRNKYHIKTFCLLLAIAWILPASADDHRDAFENAVGLYQKAEYDAAYRQFGKALRFSEDGSDVEYNLGNTAFMLGRYQQARAHWLTFIEHDHRRTAIIKAYYNIGNAWYREGRFQEAAWFYQQALAQRPDDPDARHNLSIALRQLRFGKSENLPYLDQRQKQARPPEDPQTDSRSTQALSRNKPGARQDAAMDRKASDKTIQADLSKAPFSPREAMTILNQVKDGAFTFGTEAPEDARRAGKAPKDW
jgi:tetratricopeptide (TPR) repeat protein